MIELYYYPPTKDDLKLILTNTPDYFRAYYKKEYSELPIVKQILHDIDGIDFVRGEYVESDGEGYSIHDISNTARMAIIFNVFPEDKYFFRQDFLGELAYPFLKTIPKDKVVRLLATNIYPVTEYHKDLFYHKEKEQFLQTEDEFDFTLMDSVDGLEDSFWWLREKFYDSNGLKLPYDKLLEANEEYNREE